MNFMRLAHILLLLVILISYYFITNKEELNIEVKFDTETPIFAGSGLENVIYDDNGMRSYVIYAVNLEHYAHSGDSVFMQPSIQVYQKGENIEWQITANKATLSKDQKLTLSGEVMMRNLLLERSFEQLQASDLVIDLIKRDFSSDSYVQLIGNTFVTTAGAVYGNFNKNTATLTNNVKGHYEAVFP